MSAVIQYILYLAFLIVLAIPLGGYIKKVMNGEKTFLSKILTPCEDAVYKVMRVKKDEQMNWKKYASGDAERRTDEADDHKSGLGRDRGADAPGT